ncbi:MAG: rhomboid family intramembrane serine protease, partial [Armatimonadota bacterium]
PSPRPLWSRRMIPLRDNIRSRSFPYVNVAIIVACVIVFFLELSVGLRTAVEQWAFRPGDLLPGGPSGLTHAFTALTLSMFMHGGLVHILGNMLFLWVFGDNVEDRMGHLKYLVFYVICGVAATIAHSAFALVTGASGVPMVGASGAIAGVLGAYFVLFRHSRVRTLVFLFFLVTVVDIPSPMFLVYWLVIQLFSIGMRTGVAYLAHIGGFGAGYLLVRWFADTRRRPPPDQRESPRPPPPPRPPRITRLRIE